MIYCYLSRSLLILSFCSLLFGCASRSTTTYQQDSVLAFLVANPPKPISTAEALTLITALEQQPLASEAPAQRTVLTSWVVASPDVGNIVPDENYIYGVFGSDHPYSSEFFLQYMFGMARAQATAESKPLEKQSAVESGLRSMLAAYKSLVAADESMRDRFLDELDRIRQLGKLRTYIDEVDKGKDR